EAAETVRQPVEAEAHARAAALLELQAAMSKELQAALERAQERHEQELRAGLAQAFSAQSSPIMGACKQQLQDQRGGGGGSSRARHCAGPGTHSRSTLSPVGVRPVGA
ncbi:unnamed protein product, partial [Prorocentrum cordatum]